MEVKCSNNQMVFKRFYNDFLMKHSYLRNSLDVRYIFVIFSNKFISVFNVRKSETRNVFNIFRAAAIRIAARQFVFT